MRKGMSETLMIVVSAIIILIVALVLITMFSSSITPLGNLAQAKNNCMVQAKSTCASTGALPVTWAVQSVKTSDSDALLSCKSLWSDCDCCPQSASETCLKCNFG